MINKEALKRMFGINHLDDAVTEEPGMSTKGSYLRRIISDAGNYVSEHKHSITWTTVAVALGATGIMFMRKYSNSKKGNNSLENRNKMPRNYRALPFVTEMPALSAIPDAVIQMPALAPLSDALKEDYKPL